VTQTQTVDGYMCLCSTSSTAFSNFLSELRNNVAFYGINTRHSAH